MAKKPTKTRSAAPASKPAAKAKAPAPLPRIGGRYLRERDGSLNQVGRTGATATKTED